MQTESTHTHTHTHTRETALSTIIKVADQFIDHLCNPLLIRPPFNLSRPPLPPPTIDSFVSLMCCHENQWVTWSFSSPHSEYTLTGSGVNGNNLNPAMRWFFCWKKSKKKCFKDYYNPFLFLVEVKGDNPGSSWCNLFVYLAPERAAALRLSFDWSNWNLLWILFAWHSDVVPSWSPKDECWGLQPPDFVKIYIFCATPSTVQRHRWEIYFNISRALCRFILSNTLINTAKIIKFTPAWAALIDYYQMLSERQHDKLPQ